jgi:hypothetical protein
MIYIKSKRGRDHNFEELASLTMLRMAITDIR